MRSMYRVGEYALDLSDGEIVEILAIYERNNAPNVVIVRGAEIDIDYELCECDLGKLDLSIIYKNRGGLTNEFSK